MPARNIALFFDGTWNEPDRDHTLDSFSNETNVRRLYGTCGQTDTQHTFYIPGVGTDIYVGGSEKVRLEAGLHNAPRWFERMRGGLLGTGLRERVLEAYGIICSLYRPGRGDRLFIFGFSRGAFAARSLVNFVDKVGILFDAERENQWCGANFQADILNHVQDAYSLYEGKGVPDHATLDNLLERIFSNEMRPGNREGWAVRTHFMGLWDTVATRGLPARQRQFSAPRSEDLREAVPASVMCARHALAAHEFRTLFEPLMFWETPDGHRDIEQRWFVGSHADVGGGYAAREAGLAIEPLHWIAEEARQKNLEVKLDSLPRPGSVPDRLHQEGSDANLWQGLLNALTHRITWSQLLQIRAHRTVRQPLRKAALARRLALRTRQRQIAGPYRTDSAPRAWQIGGILGRLAAFVSGFQ